MSKLAAMLWAGVALWAALAWGQATQNVPHIGYLYPSGGRQGSVVRVTVGGQFLAGAGEVYVSGEGVRALVLKYTKPLGNLNAEQRQLLQQRLREVRDRRLAELGANGAGAARLAGPEKTKKAQANAVAPQKPVAPPEAVGSEKTVAPVTPPVTLPEHPLLYDLDNKSLRELAHIASILLASRQKQQPNRQLAESVLIEVTMAADAAPGNRELRLGTPAGLTNPMVFQVGLLPEVCELEPNPRRTIPGFLTMPQLPPDPPLDLPVLVNGQILPGDVDRFRFRARHGQQVVIQVQARSLIPYLADAVPGWFQATATLYDAQGREVAYADDYRFDPDPVLCYRMGPDGEYELEIRDAIYRGREDFVYRVAVSEQPFITQVFPLGGREGSPMVASIGGWNLPRTRLSLDTRPGVEGIRHAVYQEGRRLSNAIPYAVDTLPECLESESNDTPETAQPIEPPLIVNGRIIRAGDVDVFQFRGGPGQEVVAEVWARRLNSPLDSVLRLTDASGNVVAWNDDYVVENNHLYEAVTGWQTHHADSYLRAQLPAEGAYYVQLADAQQQGGEAYGYRLRVSPPQPDFALRVTPSSVSARAGAAAPICAYVLRRDGFDGEVELALQGAPSGFQLQGARIPAGRDHVRLTLTAPPNPLAAPVSLKLAGRARIDGEVVRHEAVPADDMMQAFLYRHLLPSAELLVSVNPSRFRMPLLELAGPSPVRLPAGGAAQVRFRTGRRPALPPLQLELADPPAGVSLHDVTVTPQELAFVLQAGQDVPPEGLEDNLIVEAFTEVAPKPVEGKPVAPKRRVSLGVLPAIPIEIVPRQATP